MRQMVKVSSARSMPSGHCWRGPSVLRRPAHGGLHAQRSSMQEQLGRGLQTSRVCIRVHCNGGATSSVVPSLRAVRQPSRALHSWSVSQGALAPRSARAVRPLAASARSVRLVAFAMQQPNALVPFRSAVARSTNATANQSVKRTCKSGLRPLSPAAYLQR